jgi:hypothetical protein
MQGKDKLVYFQAMMAYMVNRCIAPVILNLGASRRWVVTIFYKIFMSIIIGCCLFVEWKRCVDIRNQALPLSFVG